ncbi:MAG TPA: hypothetical protein VMF08_05805 [Candidatus Sulfotelmatobacter sp.]|nr:hypothetical protein [Candidatus Sulfotelmatobacter sp.]
MSLLNDALKRASQTQQELDTVRISLPPPAHAPKSHAGLGWALPVLVILLIVTGGAFIKLAFFGRQAAPAPAPRITTAAVPPPAPARPVPVAPKPAAPPAKIQSVGITAPVPPSVSSSSSSSSSNPAQPPLKVQGITYSNAKWLAIVNGTTVYVGDSVNGFRIAAIYRNHVLFIAPDGSRKLVPFGE